FQRNDHHWTLEEELRGKQDPTHFGRALQDLGVGFIAAQSPQAKGRIERLWATLQDRLTSELRLRGIATLEAANAYLPEFLADFVLTPRTAPSADRRPHAASPDPRRLLRQAPAQPATPRAAPRTPPPPRHPLAAGLQTRNAAVPSHQGVTFSLNSYGDIFTGQ